jgi:hypothetical protein
MLEKEFEAYFARLCRLNKCIYFKIPDTKSINRANRKFHKEEKRPYDSVLVTPNKTYCIEAKIEGRALKPHQRANMIITNKINPHTGLVIRKYHNYVRLDVISENNTETMKFHDEQTIIKYLINYGLKH